MAWLYRYSIGHPRRVIVIAVLITVGIAPGILRLKLRTDGHALVPPDAPEIQQDHEIRENFGLDDPIVVFIRTDQPDGIFNTHTLQLVEDLTRAFEKLDGVHPASVFSLATEVSDKVFPGTLRFRRFLDPIPTTRADLLALRESLRGVQLYNGTLISNDDHATAVLVGVPSDVNRMAFLKSVNDVVGAQGTVPETIHVIGAPVAEGLMGTHILEDLGVPTSLLGHLPTLTDPSVGQRMPRNLYELRRLVAHYVGLVPLAFAIMAGVFFISFRSVVAVVLPLTEVAAALVVIFAVMGWLGIPVYLTTAVIPVILTATGITDEIHLFSRYRHELRQRPNEPHVEVLLSTMDEMTPPVLMTTISTAVGFLSFAISTIGPVQVFGLFTAGGITFCMFWSLAVIPASLSLIDPRRFVERKRVSETSWPGLDVIFRRLGGWAVRFRWAVLATAVALGAAATLEIRKVLVQDSWIDGFAPASEFHKATDAFNEQFLGTHILQVCVDAGQEPLTGELRGDAFDGRWIKFPADFVADPKTLVGRRIRLRHPEDPSFVGPPSRIDELRATWWSWIQSATRQSDRIVVGCDPRHGSALFALRLTPTDMAHYDITTAPMLKPDVIQRVADLESFIERHHKEAVGGVRGTSDYMATINYMRSGRKEAERRIPDNVEAVEWNWGEYERLRGYDRRRQIVDTDYSRSVVTVLMKNANFVGTARLMSDIREYERTNLTPYGISLSFAGDVAVSQTLIDAIVGTQVVSVLGSLIGDFLVTAILGRSLIFGLLCVLPSSLAVLLNFAVMGWVGMPLGVATSMFSAMTLGIGVDYAIHLLERYRFSRAHGVDVRTALTETVATTGSAICVDTLAVCLGFGILTLSQVPANARLGGLLVLSLVNCFVATMLLLPAVLSLRRSRQ